MSVSGFTAALLLTFALAACVYVNHLFNHETKLLRSVYAKQNQSTAYERLVYISAAKSQNSSVEIKREQTRGLDENDRSRDNNCTLAPESRFDCARDRLLSQRECEQRGCCYAPLHHSAGPPWCFYPSSYPGYKMGPFTPTTRGQAATLTRATPSYLPRDIPSLHLEVTEESAGCLHITVSSQYSVFPLQKLKRHEDLNTSRWETDCS